MRSQLAYSHTFDAGLRQAYAPAPGQILPKHAALIVPGLNNSDARHWQTLWQEQLANPYRIELEDWHVADLDQWCAAIRTSLAGLEQPAVLVAHSFGALAAAVIAAESPEKIAAVFLVAPADPDKFKVTHRLPQTSLPVPATVIASSDDPWMTDSKAAHWAFAWGAEYLRLKDHGHINSDSALGTWPAGLAQLEKLARQTKST